VQTNLGGTLLSKKGSVPYVQMMWQLLTSAVKHISESVEDMMNVESQIDLATDDSRTKYMMNRKKKIMKENKWEHKYRNTYKNVKIFKYLVSLVTNTSKQNFMFC
jgi:hypothetical protein